MRKSKKLLAIFLAAVMAVSAASVVAVSAAEDDDEQVVAAVEESEDVGADEDEDEDVTLAANEDVDFDGAKQESDAIAAMDEEHSVAAEAEEEIIANNAPAEDPVPVPGNVTNLQKTSYDTNGITLTWNAVPNATGYFVYYYNADGEEGGWHKAGTVKGATTFRLNRLRNTTQYHFLVSAFINYKGKIYEGRAEMEPEHQGYRLQGLSFIARVRQQRGSLQDYLRQKELQVDRQKHQGRQYLCL